jgi:hypothetical protein
MARLPQGIMIVAPGLVTRNSWGRQMRKDIGELIGDNTQA